MLVGLNSTTASKIQLGAGIISKTKYTTGTTIDDTWKQANVLATTSGGIELSIVPEYFVPDIDGLFDNVKGGGKQIIRYTVEVRFTTAEITADMITKALAHTSTSSGGVITGKTAIESSDYANLYILAKKSNGNIVQVTIKNGINTNGLNISTANNGTIDFVIQGNYDITDLETAPFEIEEV